MQRLSPQLLNDFSLLFKGNENAHGKHQYTNELEKSGKRKGKSWTVNEPATEEDYQAHLAGKQGLGIVPIDQNSNVSFCVIDVDQYNDGTNRYVDKVYDYRMPLIPFRSKSGGLHLYLFFTEAVRADAAIDIMKKFINFLNLPPNTEVFPKQKKLRAGDAGNWINLPYFSLGEAFDGSMKAGLEDQTGRVLEIEAAMEYVKRHKQKIDDINIFFEQLPLKDGPPCLQSIYLSGDTDYRNNYLFNYSIYLKSKYGEDFESHLIEANTQLIKPLPLDELAKTVARSKKKDYTYTCSQEPICSLCNKSECRTREHGIDGDTISKLNFEELTQYLTDPPYYAWKINGKELKFFKEQDIIMQNHFRELCMRELHVLPNRLKDITWSRIVNTALSDIKVQKVDPADDISPGAMFTNHLADFLERRAKAASKEQILIDRVYKDQDDKLYVFRAKDLVHFLVHVKQFRAFGQTEVQDKLKVLGGFPRKYYISKEQGAIRCWLLPFSSMSEYLAEIAIDSQNIDFSKEFDDQPF